MYSDKPYLLFNGALNCCIKNSKASNISPENKNDDGYRYMIILVLLSSNYCCYVCIIFIFFHFHLAARLFLYFSQFFLIYLLFSFPIKKVQTTKSITVYAFGAPSIIKNKYSFMVLPIFVLNNCC